MKRREFITLLGGAAAAWPLAARAQQAERMRRDRRAHEPGRGRSGMHRPASERSCRGWRNWAGPSAATCRSTIAGAPGDAERHRKNAAELVALAPDVMLGWGAVIALGASRTVPIVFAQSIDPVGSGIVESLARPGGNTTGFTQFEYGMSGKWLELLKQIAPGVTRAAVLRDPASPPGSGSSPPSRPWRRRSGWS